MWRTVAVCAALAVLAPGLRAQEGLTATMREERVAAPNEDKRENLQFVKRSLSLGPVSIRYQQLVDPAAGDKPVNQRYADYILGCEFPRYTWNWDLEYFLEVTVSRPGGEPVSATRAAPQEGIYVLQQGPRAVADMVWPLPAQAGRPPAQVAVRLVKPADEADWMYVRVAVEGDPEATLTGLRLNSYPTTTTGPPERQRWVTSLTRGVQMGNPWAALNPAEEWGLVLHNKVVQEDGGALLVMDPAEVQSAAASGTYAVSVSMQTRPLQAAHLAMGIFWDTPYQQAIERFRAAAPERLKRLRAVDWRVPVDLAGWERTQQEVGELLGLSEAGRAKYEGEWQALRQQTTDAAGALGKGDDAAAARRFVLLTRQAAALKATLYEPALQALVEQATK